MSILTRDKQIAVISALTEGCSIRATERLTGIHRDTIMLLGLRVGEGCAALHDESMRLLQVNRLELDELWSYVVKKQKRMTPIDPEDLGDQYVFIGIDATCKATISYRVGKRDSDNANAFLADLRRRIVNHPKISSEYTPEQRHGLALEAIFKPDIRFFLARSNDVAVGCGGVAFFADFAEVKRMYVRDVARGHGVAQALLARIERATRDAGYLVLKLETGVRQTAALRFYERAGFQPGPAFGAYATMAPQAIATSVFLQKQLRA